MSKKSKKKLSKTARIILVVVRVLCLGVAIFSGYQLYTGLKSYNEAGNTYDNLRKNAVVKQDDDSDDVASETINYEQLLQQNADFAGWLTLPNSNVDYPVVFGASVDTERYGNDYYLRHLFDGTYNVSGTVFIDYNNGRDFTHKNTVIYGHHMLNDSMFADIEKYKDQSYYDSHKEIYFDTPDAKYTIYPVAGYLTTGTGDYVQFDFSGDQEFLNYVDRFVSGSTFKSEQTIEASDQIVMFSTCSYDVDDGRYVLVGKLVKN